MANDIEIYMFETSPILSQYCMVRPRYGYDITVLYGLNSSCDLVQFVMLKENKLFKITWILMKTFYLMETWVILVYRSFCYRNQRINSSQCIFFKSAYHGRTI